MRTCLALLLAPGAALDPLAKLQVVSLARPPESQLLSAKLSVDDVACWKWKEAAMGDGAGSSCNGVERALAQRLRADGGECVVLSTCARLDVYAYGCGDVADAVAADVGGLASQFRRSRPFAPRYGDVDVRPHLAVATGAAAARHVFEVACFAGLEKCEFDPFDSHQAHVVKQVKAAFDDATRPGDGADAAPGWTLWQQQIMESIAHRRASTHQRRPTEVLLHGSDAPACDRLRALRKAAVVDGLDGAARPVAWKLLLGVGRCDAKRYGARSWRGAPAGPASPSRPTRGARSGPAARAPSARLATPAERADPRARRRAARRPRRGPRADAAAQRELRRRAAAAAAAAALARRRGDGGRTGRRSRACCSALPSELEAFWCLEALVAAKAPTYFTPNLGAPRRARASWTRCLAVVDPSSLRGSRRRRRRRGSARGAARAAAARATAPRCWAPSRARVARARPPEDLFAFPLLASLFACAPPLAEVVVLWDALLALGVHSGVLLCAALCVSLRDELLLDPDPLARLQPRNLPPLDGRRLVAGAARLAPKIPPPLFDLVLRHPVDVVDRAAILACVGDGDPGKPPPPPKPRRSSLIM
ncbi:rab GTPase-activating protein [Aureococcus anophagefferens]|uniref:Rab GTPase-activating protein n=1 Tax=Aureococcus anophagefferens TaxID=44056 RepID=A0ABR1FIZ9_AURAN